MVEKLADYRGKRDFGKTSEPKGAAAAADGQRFVIHKHAATADHYDLRLEIGGVLKSWAGHRSTPPTNATPPRPRTTRSSISISRA